MELHIKIVLIIGFVFNSMADSAKILGLFPTDTRSHYMMYGHLMQELAIRGHQVTVISPFPEEVTIENKIEIRIDETNTPPDMDFEQLIALSELGNLLDITNFCVKTCEIVLNQKAIQDIMKRKDFDLLITEIFATDCFLAIGHKLQVPTIGLVSSVALPWVNDMVGNPDNPSYIPQYFLSLSQKMNFIQRIYNTVMYVVVKTYYQIYSSFPSQKIVDGAFGNITPLNELSKNYSIILVNSHSSVNQVRPWVPQLIEVGGLHIPKQFGKLPHDIEVYLNNSKNGIIYFSLGSIAQVESMNKEKLNDIIDVLGSLKMNVLWRINATGLKNLPGNIKTYNWMPQLEVLCHPNVKLFINHGGMMGLQEATYCGVPMFGIPIFADQQLNLAEARSKGIAEIIEYRNINKKTFSEGLNHIINDRRYSENMKHVSKLFRDRPLHPLDNAIYWIEYVLRYRGAPNLKSPALHLEWYQYLLLDVYAVLFLFVFTFTITIRYCIKYLIKIVKMGKMENMSKKHQ